MSITQWFQGPKVGTPENPEIIEPGQSHRLPQRSRVRTVFQILSWMIAISAPAALLLMTCTWLIDVGLKPGGIFAWVLLFFFAPPTVVLSLVAVLADLVLSLFLVMTIFGRTVVLSDQVMRFSRRPRDVQ